MGQTDIPQSLSEILIELKKPLDPEVPEANRSRYTKLAEALGITLKENPGLLTPEIRTELGALLSSRDSRLTAAQNDLSKFLPNDLLQALDKEATQARLHLSNLNPCNVMCRIAKNLSEKLNSGLGEKPDAYLLNSDSKNSFNLAVRSLIGEFLLKAKRSGCDLPGVEKKVSEIVTQASEYARRDARPSKEETREALKSYKGSREALRKALAFVDRVENLDEGGLPTNSATLYFYLQARRAADALKESGHPIEANAIEELQQKVDGQLLKILDARNTLMEGQGGSLVTTYALAAIGASASDGSEIQKKTAQIFSELRSEYKKIGGEGFPYNFNPLILKQTERAAAARSVVAQLAIYKGGKSEDKLVNADELLVSLANYEKHFRDIFSGIGLNRTHDREDDDQLAPYYGPATIPYAFEAISHLTKEKGLTPEQREKLQGTKINIQKKLLGMFDPNGLFQAQNSNYYSSAPLYDNALTGLALEQACRDKGGAKPPVATVQEVLSGHPQEAQGNH